MISVSRGNEAFASLVRRVAQELGQEPRSGVYTAVAIVSKKDGYSVQRVEVPVTYRLPDDLRMAGSAVHAHSGQLQEAVLQVLPDWTEENIVLLEDKSDSAEDDRSWTLFDVKRGGERSVNGRYFSQGYTQKCL
jgi:hypothetical protein